MDKYQVNNLLTSYLDLRCMKRSKATDGTHCSGYLICSKKIIRLMGAIPDDLLSMIDMQDFGEFKKVKLSGICYLSNKILRTGTDFHINTYMIANLKRDEYSLLWWIIP